MADKKIRRNKGRFAGVPVHVMDSSDYLSLSFSSRALLLEFAKQYTGKNNGKLCATYSQLKPRGWRSEDTLRKCLKELLAAKLIVLTKRGMYGSGKREPNYYGLTWQPIDKVEGFEMDLLPTTTPLRKFSIEARSLNLDKAA
ncbi:hypothetical protein [Alteromonas naphthalenivorans]|uniref:Helix-turn-helix domain-containing protein n=1 Tax=Alteromonas naphthalenivorans TaxID=715451 RepID=F5ZCU9_ALTNA|nr:hypothetical protein [Alteromonas naphthalenivorans]AEF03711.1 hypothetical protein ambt_10945 [Alteromonas naphthalenivorans]